MFQWNKAKVHTSFEVFNSGGICNTLIRKPFLEQLKVMHNDATDTITHSASPHLYIIKNIFNSQAALKPQTSQYQHIHQNLKNMTAK